MPAEVPPSAGGRCWLIGELTHGYGGPAGPDSERLVRSDQTETSFETVFPACTVIFGVGASGRAGAEAAALGAHRVLFVCSPSLSATPQAASIRASLGDRLLSELHDVRAHVPSDLVETSVQPAEARKIDLVVAVGGGSAVGLCKAVL